MAPINYTVQHMTEFLAEIMKSVNMIRHVFAYIRNKIMGIVANIFARIYNIIIPVLQIEEANYKGTTKSGDKFSISAKTIKENSKKFKVLDLINPSAIINFGNGSITISSNKGEFDFNHGKIELK